MAAGDTYYDKVSFNGTRVVVQAALDASYDAAVAAGLTTPQLVQCDFMKGYVVWQQLA